MEHIVSSKNRDFTLLENTEKISILQNVCLLISVKKGTIPFYRGYGLPMNFLDKPPEVASAILFSEVEEALEEYEPRATLSDAQIVIDNAGKAEIKVVIEVAE